MSKKVLIIGGGGREHALVWKLAKSSHVGEILACPGNVGISEIGECVDISATDIKAQMELAEKRGVDLVVVGPEVPLAMGIVDLCNERDIPIFGPNREASQVEGSKLFAKELMIEGGIPTADYAEFSDYDKAYQYILDRGTPLVIKADGLAAGKGVTVAIEVDEAISAIEDNLRDNKFGEASNKLLIEEHLCGEEASVIAFVDGETVLPLISSQDHKRIYEEDEGPNTGGMGAYAPAPIVPDIYLNVIVERIFKPVVEILRKKGIEYKGVLYAGLMVGFDGPKVLEYNVRFGDPETQVLLMMLENDIYELFTATIDGKLNEHKLKWKDGSTICVVLASEGYPGKYISGMEIEGLNELNVDDTVIFHAGTRNEKGKILTSGGRVLNVVSCGNDILEAKKKVYDAVSRINFNGMYYRKDIAYKALIRYEEQQI